MPPALASNVALNLLPESPAAWETTNGPAPVPSAIPRPGRPYLGRVANFLAWAAGSASALAALAIGDEWQIMLLQAGLTTIFAHAVLRPFAHLAAKALDRH